MNTTTFLILCAVAVAGMLILAVVAVSLCRAAGRRTFPAPPPRAGQQPAHHCSPTAHHGRI